MASARLLVVTPVRDEAPRLPAVLAAMAAQTAPPALWLVIDDGSSDGGPALLEAARGRLPWLRVLASSPSRGEGALRDRLAQANEARAFNQALGTVDVDRFSHVGKLDADIELPPHYFATLLARFAADPALGVAGGSLVDATGPGGAWRPVRVPAEHVHGALKLYSRECLQAIGGVEERLGWDTADLVRARMRGFRTRRFPDLIARHHRPAGTAQGALRGRARAGRAAFLLHQRPWWVLLRAAKVGLQPPRGLSGLALLVGYGRAALERAPRYEDAGFAERVGQELCGRIGRALRAAWRRPGAEGS